MLHTHIRTATCGQLRLSDINTTVTLCGWVQNVRDKGGLIWIDLRDRYGITQLIMNESDADKDVVLLARTLGREFVVKATGMVIERIAKNDKIPTGDIEVRLTALEVLNAAKIPPFLIQDETDGGEDLRMK